MAIGSTASLAAYADTPVWSYPSDSNRRPADYEQL